MKRALALGLVFLALAACSKVPAGHVGIKVYLLGGSKGVDSEELGPGRYWIGWNEELYLFPTFSQNYVWTKDKTEQSPLDESITFQDREGMPVNTDVGITYNVERKRVTSLFQKYRKGINEITGVYLWSMVRDAFIGVSSSKAIEEIYGPGKMELIRQVEDRVREQVKPFGLNVERIYMVGELRLPPDVKKAISQKIQATQEAQQRHNEIASAKAAAQKEVEAANGKAQSILAVAQAQAKANKILAESLTAELVNYKAIEKWDGQLPKLTGGGAVPFVQLEGGPNKPK